MADMEWDNEKHRGAGATDTYGNMRVMLQDSGDYIGCIDSDFKLVGVERDKLTPNGKRYKLHEVADAPKLLEPSTKSMDEYKPCDHADMIGMWASYDSPEVNREQHGTVIIAGEPDRAGRVPCYKPEARVPEAWTFNLKELVPRFDLPRAWDVDGEPSDRERS